MPTSLRPIVILVVSALLISATAMTVVARDKPASTSRLSVDLRLAPFDAGTLRPGQSGGQFSKTQIENFRCSSGGDPTAAVDISCNTAELGQDFGPDNEIAVAVDPADPNHVVAGSNDYFYRFNNATGARQAIVPTGFFTSFDGGATWIDGQIPMRSGNGAGDPSPAFVGALNPTGQAENAVALMAQLENTAGQGGFYVSQGDVSVSRSVDGGVTWSEPVTVMMGTGTGIGPANRAIFWDKEWITVDNNPDSDWYGRAYLTATRFVNGLFGSYAESAIYLSWSDDGGLSWSAPAEISGSHPSCTFQETGTGTDCDEDQFSIPTVGPDGTLYVHFANYQNEAEWEVDEEFDSQIMVVTSTDGGESFGAPAQAAQLEDGASDMPWSVIGSQTVWGHQIRWAPYGNIAVDPTDPDHVTVIWADRGEPNDDAPEGCTDEAAAAPVYDPCNAGPGSDLDVYRADSIDGGATWGPRTLVDDASGASQWFPWGGYRSDGSLVIAWDEDLGPAPADAFVHVLWDSAGGKQVLSSAAEQIDISVTHWSGQYVPESRWPAICGPAGYSDPPVTNAEGKDCNVFHGDYTGLAVGSDDSVHVVWTGLNRLVTSPQIDAYTGEAHDGYAQDAMYARR
jgi:hypothetical protein